MPVYVYRCPCCDLTREEAHGFRDTPQIRCGCDTRMAIDMSTVRTQPTPTRAYHDGQLLDVDATRAAEKAKDADMAAYKRLRRSGQQPPAINGSARLEAKAETSDEVKSGHIFRTAAARKRSAGFLNDVLGTP